MTQQTTTTSFLLYSDRPSAVSAAVRDEAIEARENDASPDHKEEDPNAGRNSSKSIRDYAAPTVEPVTSNSKAYHSFYVYPRTKGELIYFLQ